MAKISAKTPFNLKLDIDIKKLQKPYQELLDLNNLNLQARYKDSLNRLNINKISDLWFCKPRDFKTVVKTLGPSIHLLSHEISCLVTIKKHVKNNKFFGKGKKRYVVHVQSIDGQNIQLVFFSPKNDYLVSLLPINEQRLISGCLKKDGNTYQIIHPTISYPKSAQNESEKPIYNLTYGINNEVLAKIIDQSLNYLDHLGQKLIPISNMTYFKQFNHEYDIVNFITAIKNLHSKKKFDKNVVANLAFYEMLASQIAITLINKLKTNTNNKLINNKLELQQKLQDSLPYQLTASQKHIISEINNNLAGEKQMNRLLQGDVGSGKTIIALHSALAAIESGYQVILMVPTEVLAQQHFSNTKKLFSNILNEWEIVCVVGKDTKKQRAEKQRLIKQGSAKMIIGTHALFQGSLKFANLGLAIIDEQHKFGVEQRLKLIENDRDVHILLMSATPIPRTLLLTIYSDLAVSSLNEKPKNRKPIITKVMTMEKIDELSNNIKKAIYKNKQQVYWVCPLIEDSEKLSLTSTNLRHEALKNFIDEEDMAIVHGRMIDAQKNEMINLFAQNEKKILLATTVIEVGIDVANANIIIIENAENYGLAQLHQLRGRVGRSDQQSFCILLYDKNKTSNIARQRLNIMKNCDDGFKIAENDLQIRGGGEISGTKQSGYRNFKFFDFNEHYDLIDSAKKLAKYFINNYHDLSTDEKNHLIILLYIFDFTIISY